MSMEQIWQKEGREEKGGGEEEQKKKRVGEEWRKKRGRRTLDFRTIGLGLGSSSLLLWKLIQSQSWELNSICQAWWQATSLISKITEERLVVASCCGGENPPPLIWGCGHLSVSHNAVDGPILMTIWTPLIALMGCYLKNHEIAKGVWRELKECVCVENGDMSL